MFAIEEIEKLSKQYLITLLKDLFIKSFDFLRVFYATGEKVLQEFRVCQNEYFLKFYKVICCTI
jgi:hypothetical protein